MAYADYAFYTGTYYGNTIPQTSFDKYSDMATDELDHITFTRIGAVSTLTAADQKKVKKAMCSLADMMYAVDTQIQTANKADSANIKSRTAGSETISYGQTETAVTKAASDPKFKGSLYYDAVKTYLTGTGYLYAGY